MRSDVFIAKLAHGAVAAGVAGAWMLPQNHSEPAIPVRVPSDTVCSSPAGAPAQTSAAVTDHVIVLKFAQTPSVWDKALEREFRKLALSEVAETLTDSERKRLDEITDWRNLLLHGQTTEETSLQLKRDRILERMQSVLREYVEFQAVTNQKRPSA